MLTSPSRPSFHSPPTICGLPDWRPITYTSGKIAFSCAMRLSAISFACRSTLPVSVARRLMILPRLTLFGATTVGRPARFGYAGDSGIQGDDTQDCWTWAPYCSTGPQRPHMIWSQSCHSTTSHSFQPSALVTGPPDSARTFGNMRRIASPE